MDRIIKFEEMLKKIDYVIENPNDFLYENIDEPSYQEIIECTRTIVLRNTENLIKKEKEILELEQKINQTKAIREIIEHKVAIHSPEKKEQKKYKDLNEIIEYITYSNLNEETKKGLVHLNKEDILRIKLHFLKQIIEIKRKIKNKILENPLNDIRSLQNDLSLYEVILVFVDSLSAHDEKDCEIEEEKIISNIIVIPNEKKSTYLLDDIKQYPERTKEIKNTIDKILDGYFLKTKDTRPLEGYSENLYEYKHPNGLRILYIVKGSIISICSLFYKDKQKSIKISSYYEEALNRYK